MLNSAFHILKHFVPADILRFNFEHFQIIRTDVEEVFYLVAIHGNWYLVFETDFIMNLQRTYDEADEIRTHTTDFILEGWIEFDKPESIINPRTSKLSEDEIVKRVSFKNSENSFRYAVIKLIPSPPLQEELIEKELRAAFEMR